MHAMDPRLDGVALRRHKGCRGDARQRTTGAHAIAQDFSIVDLDRAKSVLYLGRGLDDPGPMVCTPDGVRSVSRGVRQRRATAHRAGQARKATRRRCAYPCVFCLAPLPQGHVRAVAERQTSHAGRWGAQHGTSHRAQGGGMPTRHRMALGLYDARGHRKYLTTAERTAFLIAAEEALREVRTLWGCSPIRAVAYPKPWLTADQVDFGRISSSRDLKETSVGGVSGGACAPHAGRYARPRAWPPAPPGAERSRPWPPAVVLEPDDRVAAGV